ncbi:MAG: ABC transporter permease [Romboutsia sp.]
MSLKNLIKGALINLKANKVRVFLTMLGIIIGISSVIVVLSIGDGLKANVISTTGETKANKINIGFYPNNYDQDISTLNPFRESDFTNLNKIEGVEKAEKPDALDLSEIVNDSISGEGKYLNKSSNIFAISHGDSFSYPELASGRYFESFDTANDVIVLKYETAKDFFATPEDAIGKALSIDSTMFEVIGVLRETDDIFSTDEDLVQQSSIDRITNVDIIQTNDTLSDIDIFISPGYDFDIVIANVIKSLEELHPQIDGNYEAYKASDVTKAFDSIISSITLFVSLITSISLFVGGIGVMNIMYVSVTERKREIGIRRAIGATPRDILLQFLLEAIFVTLIGGLLGIFFGFVLSQIAGLFMPFKPVLTIKSFIGASSVSIIVGIIFGIIPALKASKLDPIKAIYN